MRNGLCANVAQSTRQRIFAGMTRSQRDGDGTGERLGNHDGSIGQAARRRLDVLVERQLRCRSERRMSLRLSPKCLHAAVANNSPVPSSPGSRTRCMSQPVLYFLCDAGERGDEAESDEQQSAAVALELHIAAAALEPVAGCAREQRIRAVRAEAEHARTPGRAA